MLSRKERDSMLKFVESSKNDKMRDKKMGYREGSKRDAAADSDQARKADVPRGSKNQRPPKGWM